MRRLGNRESHKTQKPCVVTIKKDPRRYSPSMSRITSNSSACGQGGGEGGAENASTSKAVNLSQSASGGGCGG